MNIAVERLLSIATVTAAGLGVLLVAPTTAGASAPTTAGATATAVTPASVTCTVSIVNGGHTVTERCVGTLAGYGQFRLVVNFCNTANCSLAYGNWANFGRTSTVSSGGYATRDNVLTQYR